MIFSHFRRECAILSGMNDTATRKCPDCGADNPIGTEYCAECNHPMEPLATTTPIPPTPPRPPRTRKLGGLPGSGDVTEEQGKVIPRRQHSRIGFFGIGASSKRPPEGSAPGWLWLAIAAIAMVIVIAAAVSIATKEPPFQIPGATQLQARRADSLYKSLKTDTTDTEGYVKLGDLLYDTQNYARAVDYYRRALTLDPTQVDAQVDLAVSLHQSDRSGEALAELNDVLSRNPDHVIAHFDRGVILEFMGRLEEARDEYQAVLALQARPEVHDVATQRLDSVLRKLGGEVSGQLPPGHP